MVSTGRVFITRGGQFEFQFEFNFSMLNDFDLWELSNGDSSTVYSKYASSEPTYQDSISILRTYDSKASF